MTTSKQWQVYLPTGASAADTFALLRNGDIIDLVDNTLGPLVVEYGRSMDDNKPFEFARFRNGETSELVLQVTEEGAKGIDQLRASDCPLPVQRRECSAGGDWSQVEHYGLVQYGQRGGSSLTNNGTDSRDDLPAVRFPGTFRSGERYMWDKSQPIQYDKGSGANNAPVGIVYCDEPGCANCGTDGCQRLYALTTNGTNAWALETSKDGGHIWTAVATGLSATLVGRAIYCYYGRVFLSFSSGAVYYSDTPLVSGSWVAADKTGIPTTVPAAYFVRFAHPRKSHVKVLYALYYTSFENGIAISYDNGETWDDVRTAASGPNLYDIAAAGSWVAAVGVQSVNGSVVYSDDLGETFTTLSFNLGHGNTTGLAIAMDLPNPLESGAVTVYVLSRSVPTLRHEVHKFTNFPAFADWTLKWSQAGLDTVAPGIPEFNLYTTAAGYLLWVHMPSLTDNMAYILKSIDGAASFVNMDKAISVHDDYGDRFAVCPNDGNKAILLGGDLL